VNTEHKDNLSLSSEILFLYGSSYCTGDILLYYKHQTIIMTQTFCKFKSKQQISGSSNYWIIQKEWML